MINISIADYSVLIAFWLCFTRWLTIIIQLPLFEDLPIPSMVKAMMALLVTYAFFPYTENAMLKDVVHFSVDNFWFLTIGNALIGITLGLFIKILMNLFLATGSIITQQVGFGAIRYFDPSSNNQVGPFEKLIKWTLILMILSSGALIPMFKGALNSFFTIHLYDLGKLTTSVPFFLETFKSIFFSALLLSSPIIFTNIMIMAVLGIIARSVPQMNVLMVSFVINIGLGLLVFTATSDEFFNVAFKIYTEKLGEWFQLTI